MDFELETNDICAYLAADDVIDWDTDAVASKSWEITNTVTCDVDKVRALFEWVRDTIPHSCDAGVQDVACCASEVLRIGTGLCYAKSHLLAAMLRAAAIPAGFCYQTYYEPELASGGGIALHGLNGVHIGSLGRWVRVDCRGNKDHVDAQFSIGPEMLAFPDLEFLDCRIYAKPLPNVIAALRTWPTLRNLWPNLPGPVISSHDREPITAASRARI